MTARPSTQKAPPPAASQVEIDHAELASTEVSPVTARLFSLAFFALLCAVPVGQAVLELRHSRIPQALDVFKPVIAGFRRGITGDLRGGWSVWREGIMPEALHSYEASVENASAFKGYVQPRIQEFLTGTLGFGNEKVIVGRGGWLFYQPGFDYVTQSSIVDHASLDLTAKRMVDKQLQTSPHPDPRPALLQFAADCQRAGIRLVVFPAADKVMLQPGPLYRGDHSPDLPPPDNTGYKNLVSEMQLRGVDWFDPRPEMVSLADVRFLRQDTHWTPEFMDTVAETLAAHIHKLGVLSDAGSVPMRVVEGRVARVGDLVDMLKLTRNQSVFAPHAVTIQEIIDERSGNVVAVDPGAEVLLLGDSYTNIYSQADMGWGSGAGLAEHLAYHLRRPIDVIAFNGGGSTRVRAELGRKDYAQRLGSKKIIVYEFAIRNLLGEDWKPIPMTVPTPNHTLLPPSVSPAVRHRAPAEAAASKPEVGTAIVAASAQIPEPAIAKPEPVVVVGSVTQTSRVPPPGTAPYKDCLTFVKIRIESVESGVYAGTEMIVAFFAMKDDQWLPPARYTIGDRLRLKVIPLSKAEARFRGMQRADDIDDFSLRPFFALL